MHRAVGPRLPRRRRGVRDAALVRRAAFRARRAPQPARATAAACSASRHLRATTSSGPPMRSWRRTGCATRACASRSRADRDRPGLVRGDGPPTVLVVALPLSPWPSVSTAVISRLRRDEQNPLAGVKTVSLAESVTALAEARAAGADEALVLNHRGDLCEATTANVFLVHDGVAATPPLESGCLAGITREHVLELGAVERVLSRADIATAQEAFLTSSTREVQPLVAVDGRPVGDGERGPVTAPLAEAYAVWCARRSAGRTRACRCARSTPPQAGAEPVHPARARAGRRPAAVLRRPRLQRAQDPDQASPSSRRSGTSRCSRTSVRGRRRW